MSSGRFDYSRRFDGVLYPRYDDRPDGPQDRSMVACTCGRYWKDHEFATGACPAAPDRATIGQQGGPK